MFHKQDEVSSSVSVKETKFFIKMIESKHVLCHVDSYILGICFNIIHHQLPMKLSIPFCKKLFKRERYNRLCTCEQVLASTAKNMLLLDLGMTVSFPTIVIPRLRNTDDPLALDDEQASWFGKSLFCGSEVAALRHSTTPMCLTAELTQIAGLSLR